MKKYSPITLSLIIASLAMAIASVAARTALTGTLLDRHGVYVHGSVWPTVYHVVLGVIVAALAIAYIIIGRKNTENALIKGGTMSMFAAFSSALLLAVNIIISLYNILMGDANPALLDVLEIASAIIAVIFFVLVALQKGERTVPLAITSLFPAVWCAVCVLRIYFDTSVLTNSPNKILGEFALLLAMLFFLMEARNQISIPLKGFYGATALTAPIMLLSASIPNLIFRDRLGSGTASEAIHYVIYIALSLFIYARLFSLAKQEDNK